jgi:hypothetical protein
MALPFGNELVAGDSWNWTFCDLPSDWDPAVYLLNFYLRGPAKLDLTSDGTSNIIAATSAQTKDLSGGNYAWQLVMAAKDASSRTEISRGTVRVLEDLQSKGDNYDPRSFVKKTLDAIEAALADVMTHNMSEYQIPGSTGGRAIKYVSRTELENLRSRYTWLYKQEQIASGELSDDANHVKVRFV